MWSLLKKRLAGCGPFRERLEEVSGATPGNVEPAALVAAMPTEMHEHAARCADCHTAAEELLEARALLKSVPSRADLGGPWFASRVMAAIAARKAELARAVDAWAVVPRFAARLTWVSAVALLLASTWLYERPKTTPVKPVLTDITGEPLSETALPSNYDDVLVSLSEKPQ